MRSLLYLAFVLSGGAGLIYEATWSRYLALLVGHSAYAQVLVIGTFLGGMALGAFLAGERSRTLARPLLWYAGVELVLAALGMAYDPVFRAMQGWAYATVFPALGAPLAVSGVAWGLGLLSILPASVLLGTTFPLLTAGVLRLYPDRAGHTVASLYFANSLGGAMGVLVGGFVLVAAFGLPGTLATAALLNATAGAGVWVAARGAGAAPALEERPAAAEGPAADEARARPPGARAPGTAPGAGALADPWRLLLGVSFLTAVASFIYEIGWIRMLSLVMGSATHSFEIMLSAFILGLALGALQMRRWADTHPRPLRLLGFIQWGMGLAALFTLPIYAASFDWMAELLAALDSTPEGYGLFNLARYGLAALVMIPSTFLAGMTLPLITTVLLRAGRGERAIGWVYGVNTLGSIVGVVMAGLVLMPWLGLKGMIVAGALLDMGLGVVLLHRSRVGDTEFRRVPALAGAGALVVAGAMLLVLEWDRAVLTSGVYRYGRVSRAETRPVLYYRDGRTATVGAYFTPVDSAYVLSTNGKPDASLTQRWIRAATERLEPRPLFRQDETTQVLLALLALAHRPDARTGVVVGLGSGITTHYLLGSPDLEEVVTVELERAMVEGARVFYPANRRAFDDPRSEIALADAKAFFARQGERWDVVVSEPSNPWVSGTSSLFTVEFYRQVRRHLAEDGILVQWIHLYEMEDRLVASVLAALHQVFPRYRAFLASRGDLVLVAGNGPELPDPDWSVFDFPDVARSLRHIPDFRPEHLRTLWLFDRAALAPLLDRWLTPNSDFYPVLDLGAERARYLDRSAEGIRGFSTQRFQVPAALSGWRMELEPYSDVPIPGLYPMWSWARSAWLREAVAGARPAESAPLPPFRDALYQHRRLQAFLDRPGPPPDWGAWLGDVVAAEGALHGGTTGAADSAFFAQLSAYMEEREAPGGVRAAVDFLRGLAAWDFSAAADAGAFLTAEASRGRSWLPPSLLLDGTVVAALKAGRPGLGAQALEVLTPMSGRAPDDFRLMVLQAQVAAAGGS